jgi:hypothetical protein
MSVRKRVWVCGAASVVALVGCNALLAFDDYSVPSSAVEGGSPADLDAGDAADAAANEGGGDGSGDPCLAANKPQVEITEVAKDLTLECKNDYVLRNQVFVRNGATLTIQPGTTILGTRGDISEFNKVSVLVVQPGGRINAVGTVDKPIVFTSMKPVGQKKAGDWGGVVLLGNAVINQGARTIEGVGGVGTEITYGGNNDDDNSGTMKYVRIEYGGFKLGPNNEINGLTFGGVGRATTIDFVQVRMVLDDCFEFFGGTVNAMHLACQYGQDDGIDWDFGYRGKIQFAVIQQDPNVYDDMNGIEADNGANATEWVKTPISEPTLFNLTMCGAGAPTVRPTVDGGPAPLRTRFGMVLRRHTRAHIANSIFLGFESGFDADYKAPSPVDFTTVNAALDLRNIIFFNNVFAPGDATANIAFLEVAGGTPAVTYGDDDLGYDEIAALTTDDPLLGNRTTDPGISGCFDPKAPSFGPAAEIPAGDIVPPAGDPFFVPVAYIGAFKDIKDPWATIGKWPVWNDQ